MASGVLAKESLWVYQSILVMGPTQFADQNSRSDDPLSWMRPMGATSAIQGVRLSCRCNEVWGCRLASALRGTGDICSGAIGADAAGVGTTPAALGLIGVMPCNVTNGSAGCCNGKANTARTGEFNWSASMASRDVTATSTYPGTSSEPTAKGRGGFPSTEINATPSPLLLATIPDSKNLADGTGPAPVSLGGVTPRSLANEAVLPGSGNGAPDAASGLTCKPADVTVCIQYQPDITTVAQTSTVAMRQPIAFCSLDISISSSHSNTSARKPSFSKLLSRPTRTGAFRVSLQGFTLIELMVVLVIIGVLAALIVPNVLDRADDARVLAARTDVSNLQQALKLYRLDNQRLPSADQGLQALIVRPTAAPVPLNWKPYLDKLPNDPWGRPYQYLNPGIKGEVDVMSLGADGQPGGEGKNADIGSWQ